MKKILIYIAVLLVITVVSCTKNFQKINTNPTAFISAEPSAVLPGVFLSTINRLERANIETFWEYGHIIDVQGRYNTGNDAIWNDMYVKVLGNTVQLKKLYQGNAAYANVMAVNDIWECYVYAFLVGSYGPIPYTHMGDLSNPYVAYDDENTVYASLLTRLKADAAAIKVTGGDKFPTDPVYGGDMSKWIKFANSLRLRIALTVQNNLPDLAVANIKELMTNETTLLTSDADDPKFTYGTASGSQSVYNIAITQSGTQYTTTSSPVMSDYSFTYFRSYKDPRIDAYFLKSAVPFNITDTLTSTADAKHYIVSYPIPYLGEPKSTALLSQWSLNVPTHPTNDFPFVGSKVPDNYSLIQPVLYAAARPFYIMTYAEVCFMKAEAALKGYGGTLGAELYYNAGVTANFTFWGLTTTQATTYLAQNGIKWGTAGKGFNYDLGFISTSIPADNLKKIWIQQWLNYFNDEGFEAWLLQRRTQNLVLPPHTNPGSGAIFGLFVNLPDRFNYPAAEGQNNATGYIGAVKALGGTETVYTTLKIEPPYTPIDWSKKSPFYDIGFVQKWYGPNIQDAQAAVGTAKVQIISSY